MKGEVTNDPKYQNASLAVSQILKEDKKQKKVERKIS